MGEGQSLDIPRSWAPALEAARAGGVLLLLGAVDSGKSTLAAALARTAREGGRRVAVVDADVGQSSIGPPACVGLAWVESPPEALEDLACAALDFVGVSSPPGRLLDCVASAHSMVRAAREGGAETVVVDTTGLIAGPIARALKAAKVRTLDPDWLVALQAEDEVEHLLAPYARRSRPAVLRLARSRRAKPRSRAERALRRHRAFARHFAGGKVWVPRWDEVPIENSAWTSGEAIPGHVLSYCEEALGCEVLYAERLPDGLLAVCAGPTDPGGVRALRGSFGGAVRAVQARDLSNLLVGLLGPGGETLGLGVLETADFRARALSIYTAVSEPERARGLRLGAMRLARDGTEQGWNEPGALG